MKESGGVPCELCGQPAKGYASINGKRYCHDDPSPTCYERAQYGLGNITVLASYINGQRYRLDKEE